MNEQSSLDFGKTRQGKAEEDHAGGAQATVTPDGEGQGEEVAEEWRAVVGYEGIYEVSNFGEIRSIDRVRPHGNERTTRFLKGRRISYWINCNGYKMVALSRYGIVKKISVHSLVCSAFHIPFDGAIVNHLNGNKLDNNALNLEWTTYGENNAHAYRTGLKSRIGKHGEDIGTAKLSESQAREILQSDEGTMSLSRRFNVNKCTILRVRKRITWAHL